MTIRITLNSVASKAFTDRDTRVKIDIDENSNVILKGTWREDAIAVTAKIGRMPSGNVWFRVNDKMLKRLAKRGVSFTKGRKVMEVGTYRKLVLKDEYTDETGVATMNVG